MTLRWSKRAVEVDEFVHVRSTMSRRRETDLMKAEAPSALIEHEGGLLPTVLRIFARQCPR